MAKKDFASLIRLKVNRPFTAGRPNRVDISRAATRGGGFGIEGPADTGGGGGGDEFVLQLGGENLQLGGEDLTLGA